MSALEDEPLSQEDIEFWELAQVDILKIVETYDAADEPLRLAVTPDACQECGATGACDYDADGRPMVHIPDDSDE